MKTYDNGLKRIWYDPHLRLWTLQRLDAAGDQVGSVDYRTARTAAFAWLADPAVD